MVKAKRRSDALAVPDAAAAPAEPGGTAQGGGCWRAVESIKTTDATPITLKTATVRRRASAL
jgi:hypothetical protein